jgi:hypothetical protein
VILHLKCKKSDFETNNATTVEGYIDNNEMHTNIETKFTCQADDLNAKIGNLAIALQHDRVTSNRSACFWCTCTFDTPTIYIPKFHLGGTYHCYGCFCSPECAAASLFKENIEQSVRFERYSLLHHMYGKPYGYEANIIPAPDPHYTLDKFYGTLTIDEYRQLSRNKQTFLIIDKPMSRCLPELYEDIPDEPFGIKMRGQSNKTKADIMKQTFKIK